MSNLSQFRSVTGRFAIVANTAVDPILDLNQAEDLVDIAYGNGKYVLLSYNNTGFFTQTSSDGGYTWGNRSQRGVFNSTTYQWSRIFFNGTQFIVCEFIDGNRVRVFKSSDGINWDVGTTAWVLAYDTTSGSMSMAVGGNNIVLAARTTANVTRFAYSNDSGSSWNISSTIGPTKRPFGVQWAGGNNFVSPSYDGSVLLSTDGGATWSTQAGTFPVPSAQTNDYPPYSSWDGTNTIWPLYYSTGSMPNASSVNGLWLTSNGSSVERKFQGFYSYSTTFGSRSFVHSDVSGFIGGEGILHTQDSFANYFVEQNSNFPTFYGAMATNGTTIVAIYRITSLGFLVSSSYGSFRVRVSRITF